MIVINNKPRAIKLNGYDILIGTNDVPDGLREDKVFLSLIKSGTLKIVEDEVQPKKPEKLKKLKIGIDKEDKKK